ncbi:RNA-directed DNA polymerase, eukaryota [Tanacetum coccineum]
MNCLSLNVQGLGSKAKKDWIKELNNKHKVNFLFFFVQETKLDCISDMDVKVLWGNYKFEYTISEAVGNSGGILCVWDPSVFRKEHHVVSNNFVALYGSWVSNQAKLLVVSIYAPQSITSKRSLWSYISSLISRWDGHLVWLWAILMKLDAWRIVWVQCTMRKGFDQMVSETWNNIDLDDNNKMVRFKKKLQILKKEIRSWVNDCKKNQSGRLVDLRSKLCHIDKSSDARDYMQKAKIQWAIEGDENSIFFHGIINRKRANLAIKGVMVDGEWVDDPCRVKEEFCLHFANRFRAPAANRCKLNYTFPNRLSSDQLDMLESPISRDEVRNAVWGCGENKSPGPDGFHMLTQIRGRRVESSLLALIQSYIEGTLLSNMEDRWVWDLNGEGVFRVKDVRILLDECFLPKAPTATRWVKYVPIKINVFAWKVFLDRLPTRSNLQHRDVLVSDILCPLCSSTQEDSSHLFFSCRLATDIVRLVCHWWNLSWTPLGSYADWLNWFNSIRLSSKVKDLLEGVLYITWWSVWMFRNQLLFSSKAPRKDVIFDDIVSRSFTWCLSRCNCTFSWDSWLQHPYLISL